MSARQTQERSLPLQGGGLGWGSMDLANDPHPTASRSTSPLQGEVREKARAKGR